VGLFSHDVQPLCISLDAHAQFHAADPANAEALRAHLASAGLGIGSISAGAETKVLEKMHMAAWGTKGSSYSKTQKADNLRALLQKVGVPNIKASNLLLFFSTSCPDFLQNSITSDAHVNETPTCEKYFAAHAGTTSCIITASLPDGHERWTQVPVCFNSAHAP
jgi:hypothetical protein